ncbi:MAG: metal-sensing transcriptional repressor [Atopobiaceae bacterium]|nr:metal-sensing transcriptional repressor [Atopobiaceae bacterium]MCH4180535.1 metal-sensing transcriptional repressor [Atopobiaceae bacterium]MCH4214260.1 metal-sensing transcriptional repressor [Atopobiaceae bacterium]MCH4229443.1 metal-sensing transcriptional repressor [Atopobiaceae bacterium]MCH4276085.1 metal-sensing transcriptional repressor [Atopobiaceae bacterium]
MPTGQTASTHRATTGACTCQHKATPRTDDLKHDLACRLHRISGQVAGIEAMIEDDRYCADVLTQLAAVEKAVRSVSATVLQDHLETCVVEQVQAGNVDVVDEVMDLIRRFS